MLHATYTRVKPEQAAVDSVPRILYTWRMGKGEAKSKHQTFRIDPELKRLADDLVERHGTGSLSDYIRGLIILDAIFTELDDFRYEGKVPFWLFIEYPEDWIKDALPELFRVRKMLGRHRDLKDFIERMKKEKELLPQLEKESAELKARYEKRWQMEDSQQKSSIEESAKRLK